MNQLKKRISSGCCAVGRDTSRVGHPFKVMPVTAVEETDPGTNYYIDAQGNRHLIPNSTV